MIPLCIIQKCGAEAQQSCGTQIMALQLEKVQIKLSQHQAMESGLQREQAALERERRAVMASRGLT